MIPLKIAGNGIYTPEQTMPSSQLDEIFGHEKGWTENKFGIRQRGVASAHETSSYMGEQAARTALAKAGWEAAELDVIIGACGVMEQPIPSTSVLIQQKLGIGKSGVPAFDINLTCLSFLSALDIVAMGMACGRWKKALIVSSDIASAGIDYAVPETASIFGDGAAAICVEAASEADGKGVVSQHFESYGDYNNLATLRAGGTKLRVSEGYDALLKGSHFEMDSFGIFKAAAKSLPALIDRVLGNAGKCRDSIDLIICHQASRPGVEHIRRLFKSRPERVVNIFADFGNQIATSLPTALSYALDNGLVKAGNHVLLLGTAAGISAGAMVIKL